MGGITSTMVFRNPDNENSRKMRPAMNTAPSATCQDTPRAITIAKVKMAFSPMYGATPNGLFAYRPHRSVATPAVTMVATIAGPNGMPAEDSMTGLTIIM